MASTAIPNSQWAVIDADETTKLVFFVAEQLFYPVRTPVPIHDNVTRCVGSCFGWLIMGDTISSSESHLKLFLLNPCTDQRVQLPPYTAYHKNEDTKVILCADPNHSNRVVVALKDYKGMVSLYKLGGENWTFGDRMVNEDCYDIFFKGVIYGVHYWSPKMFTIGFGGDGTVRQRPFPHKGHEKFRGSGRSYFLVESEGELLLVIEDNHRCNRESLYHRNGDPFYKEMDPNPEAYYKPVYEAYHFGVFKLDFKTRSWVELTSLGDRMLLLDSACSVSLDATKFSKFGFKPNCIYYTNTGFFDDYGWHEFCLDGGRIERFGVDFQSIIPIPPLS